MIINTILPRSFVLGFGRRCCRLLTLICFVSFSGINNGYSFVEMRPAAVGSVTVVQSVGLATISVARNCLSGADWIQKPIVWSHGAITSLTLGMEAKILSLARGDSWRGIGSEETKAETKLEWDGSSRMANTPGHFVEELERWTRKEEWKKGDPSLADVGGSDLGRGCIGQKTELLLGVLRRSSGECSVGIENGHNDKVKRWLAGRFQIGAESGESHSIGSIGNTLNIIGTGNPA